jgi:transcription elongation factor GreA
MEEVKAKLQEELATLEDELHFKLPKEIQKAREFGDLRENAEYKAAMERQSIVNARIRQIHERLNEVKSIDISKIPTDRAAYGSTVVLYDLDKDDKVTYRFADRSGSDGQAGRRRHKSKDTNRHPQF